MLENFDESAKKAGEDSPVVEYFGIDGLFGYRSVSLNSRFAATILIAKNGAGKTTLLGALDAFLRCQFWRLRELQFSKIECRIKGLSKPLVLHKEELDEFIKTAESGEIARVAKDNEIEPTSLLNFVAWEYSEIKRSQRELSEHPVFKKIYMQSSHTMVSTKAFFDQLEKSISLDGSKVWEIKGVIQKALSNYEIVYLPTYRRIELSLPDSDDRRLGRRPQSIQSRLGITGNGLHSGDIQFGLSDISQRLFVLNQDILAESNQGYREISANIINDLISGDFEREVPSLEDRPSKEALSVFFARVQDGRRSMGPFSTYDPMLQIPDLNKIYDDAEVPGNSRKFLNYFLGKLNKVIQKTRDVEGVVEEFVNNCNRYLSAQDDSVKAPNSPKPKRRAASDDDKILTLDRRNLGVNVISKVTKRKIMLDALSSGEKQMISLFAKLYLYPRKKIVLIDEPELSLSIDWQKKILMDIVNAPLCDQMIAITHSPFVFDNSLEPFATALRSRVDLNSPALNASLEEEEEHE